mmetsp:Transcript_24427/g.21617  ORF Transcript_24427/g.21617 Transcript_24427/m.21617 type:complete len:103 (+) Transcript_24427:229-537(+)|eukprot:CAMPEP_0114595992 /NCGR_PEP_ID=MMETSP0125-20121206/17933_1 /TAXON_ID=485358 ORGANISM="Aristerostoma sp., Strain ATCC 50986" /NCGR_SAMPLE_ID=MMETSP0125 /ASSEMBLY_ACC=CAM_ASM_000245 /LENGTH=102 /DNA_ID=CAMNT_0001798419 /DNA_START=169 /DNA_END=477 /DNA_ORIENTATION=-
METIKYKNIEMMMFDLGGGARNLWSYYFDNLDALIFVVDSTDVKRIPIVREELLRVTSMLKDNNYVVLFFFNKQDCNDKMDYIDMMKEVGVNEIEFPIDVII